MADAHKYQAHEVLNRVLNSAETAIQVDIVSGAEYAEDAEHTTADVGQFVLGVRNDTLAALGGTDGDYVPFQMNSSGALFVEAAIESGKVKSGAIASGAVASGAIASGAVASGAVASGALASGSVADGAMVTLGAKADAKSTSTDTTSITAMQVLKQISASVQETATDTGTIDSDTNDIKTAVQLIDNAISGSEMQVDVVTLPASTNTLEVVGDAADNAAAAGNPVLSGGRYDSPGDDNSTVRALDDNDVGALALDPTGALYVREHLGQTGSCFVSGTAAVTAAIGKFVAIQFLEDTVFNGTDGLVATDLGRWPDDSGAATDISSSNTAAVGSQTFPQGMTIFGRWDSFILVSGAVIAYVGNV